jgi:uncharacterized membrane protein YkoI
MNKLLTTLLLITFVFSSINDIEAKEKSQKKYECQLISRASAIKQAQSRVNGKIVGVQLSQKGSRSIYKVRMLVDKKRVKTVSVKACR